MTTSPLLTDPVRAWAPFEPTRDDPWDLARVAHLHRRAGFAAPWGVLERDRRDGLDTSVERLLDGEPATADGRPAASFDALLDGMARQLADSASLARLQGIWLYRMVFSGHPLRERMTLFWHNHFATSNTKVNNTGLMQRQNDLFRAHALGLFPALLAAIGKDPAMLIWLDASANRKARPNENYAREVMELFTLGRGHYSERDVQEAARAFTGWFVQRDRFRAIAMQHDDGEKTILGHTGRFGGDDIPAILLEQPACAGFLCTKLVRYFLTETDPVTPELVDPLAKEFRASGYEVRVPLRTILRSALFHDRAMRRRRVKCPVEYAVGTIRALEVVKPTVQADALAEACTRMGQGLYAPPSVAGWEWGPAWANSTTLLNRANLSLALLSDEDAALGRRCDPLALARKYDASTPEQGAEFLIDLLVQDAFDRPIRRRVVAKALAKAKDDPGGALREAATLVLTAPEYQLA
ncbi:MAG: hypothetical protein QOE66_998 [Chloroflexota bacterium]|nr:hypothetical protein [Chloroflexota bacterium]